MMMLQGKVCLSRCHASTALSYLLCVDGSTYFTFSSGVRRFGKGGLHVCINPCFAALMPRSAVGGITSSFYTIACLYMPDLVQAGLHRVGPCFSGDVVKLPSSPPVP